MPNKDQRWITFDNTWPTYGRLHGNMQVGSISYMPLGNPSWLMTDLTFPVISSSSARFSSSSSHSSRHLWHFSTCAKSVLMLQKAIFSRNRCKETRKHTNYSPWKPCLCSPRRYHNLHAHSLKPHQSRLGYSWKKDWPNNGVDIFILIRCVDRFFVEITVNGNMWVTAK